jgi:hypothetical protein
MKNVHLLPTDKPSRLFLSKRNHLQFLKDNASLNPNNHYNYFEGTYQNIYLTNDEKIKMDDWYLDDTNSVRQAITECESYWTHRKDYQKITLTTDIDLIAEGVQPIDNEFLEWFVKNPSCEFVEVGYGWIRLTETDNEGYWVSIPDKQFEMQQEEPKQEYELKDFESSGILDILNMGNVTYLSNGDVLYNPNLFFTKRDNKWFIKTEEPKQETLEDSIYQAIGLAANEQGIINQALATSKVMDVLKKQIYETKND